jgi:LPS sulfotransferase NodH
MSPVKPLPSAAQTVAPAQRFCLPEYDQLPFRDPSWTYLILSPQCTGGNYLCRRIGDVRGRFGMPGEYLDPAAARMLASRLLPGTPPENIPFASYMGAVQRARTSADGCFGIKVQPAQLAAFAPGDRALFDFAASFERIVVLTRRDKLGQAISGTMAQLTGSGFKDGTPPAMDDARLPQLFPVIAANLARYIDEDRRIAALGKALDRPWLRLLYEDIARDGQEAFACLVDFLAGGEPIRLEEAADVPVPELRGDFPEKLRARFLRYIGGDNAP